MKQPSILNAFSILILCLSCTMNSNKTDRNSDFLIEMADARMMDFEEGKLAAARGTTKDIRDYGMLMEKDQTTLLHKIHEIAQADRVVLPKELSKDKASALADLKKLQGKDFDEKFISMIKIDHQRDVREFGKAQEENQGYLPRVHEFAKMNLPLIQSHLDAIERIEDKKEN